MSDRPADATRDAIDLDALSTGARQPRSPNVVRWIAATAVLTAVGVMAATALTGPASLQHALVASPGTVSAEPAIAEPLMFGRLSDGRAYRVRARSAVVAVDGEKGVRLKDLDAAMQLPDAQRVDVTAPEALFDQESETLALSGGVVARRSDGYELETETARIWQTPEGIAADSDTPATLTGPQGKAVGSGFTAGPGFDPLRLKGPAKLVISDGVSN